MNDYTPIFSNLPLTATVREGEPRGTFVLNVTAEDEDSGFNAALEIFLLDVSSPWITKFINLLTKYWASIIQSLRSYTCIHNVDQQ